MKAYQINITYYTKKYILIITFYFLFFLILRILKIVKNKLSSSRILEFSIVYRQHVETIINLNNN